MSKKIIGITGPSVFSSQVQEMIEQSFEAIPLLLNQNIAEDLIFMASQCDGILLAGGSDVCPTFYGKEITNHSALRKFDFQRDKREKELIEFAFAQNKPLAGICRGHQMLGIHHGIRLITHIGNSFVCHNPTSADIQMGDEPVHYIKIVDRRQEELGMKKLYVNSFHHQALAFSKDAAKEQEKNGVDVLASSNLNYDSDASKETKIIELMRGINNNWISCQWHPEVDWRKNRPSKWFVREFKKMLGYESK